MRKILLAILLSLVPGFASAQDAQPDVKRVLIIGDQLAGGMGAGLIRMAESDNTIQVVNRFNESSGLARPEIYDWAAAIPKITEGKNINSAIVLMGLNDRRDIRLADKVLKFGSPEWNTLYQSRVDALLDALTAQHIQVFWMGEPPMGDPALDADMQNLTALVRDRLIAKGAGFIDLRAPFANPQGGYTDRGSDENGTDRRLREANGVTFFKMGNNRLGQIALAAVKSGGQLPNVASAVPVVPLVPAPLANAAPVPKLETSKPENPKPENNGPIFGQEGMEDLNTVAVQGSKALTAAVEQDRAVKAAQAASSIGIGAAKGSNAEALFTKGLAGAPPAGRFDDFTAGN